MFTPTISVVLACLPAAYELDFGTLAKAASPHNYTIVLTFKGEPDVKIPYFIGRHFTADELADSLLDCLSNPSWKLRKNGGKVIIYGYDDVLIQKVTVEGGGAKPAVRRVPYIRPEKKK